MAQVDEVEEVKERAKQLQENAKAQAVPATRLGRMATFGGLGISLGIGTLAEASRRYVGLSEVYYDTFCNKDPRNFGT